jgi:hypothetical protein
LESRYLKLALTKPLWRWFSIEEANVHGAGVVGNRVVGARVIGAVVEGAGVARVV